MKKIILIICCAGSFVSGCATQEKLRESLQAVAEDISGGLQKIVDGAAEGVKSATKIAEEKADELEGKESEESPQVKEESSAEKMKLDK